MKRILVMLAILVTMYANSQNVRAVLKNFRIEANQPSRVYFDSTNDISGLSISGFVISGKTISSITVNGTSTTGHYFTVTVPFTFWDNNTIRLGEITDTNNRQPDILSNFTLEYIDNLIPEPASSTNRFVTSTATGTGDGLTEATAWTIKQGFANAKAGQTVWIKAGTYNESTLTQIINNGQINNPIKFVGYKSNPGDITNMYYKFDSRNTAPALDSRQMPLMDGSNGPSNIYALNKSYIIIRNIQATRYLNGFNIQQGKGILIDNCISKDMYGRGDDEGGGFNIRKESNGAPFETSSYRLINSISINAGMSNIWIQGKYNLVENCSTYCDKVNGGGTFGSDYHISIVGEDNILRNSTSSAINNTVNASSHGMSIRGASKVDPWWGAPSKYNLIEKCFIKTGGNDCLAARNNKSDFNVFKDNIIEGFGTGSYDGTGISAQTGAKYNVWERIYIKNMYSAMRIIGGTESGINPLDNMTTDNIVRNIIVFKCNEYNSRRA